MNNVNVSGPVQPTATYKTKVLKGNHSFASQVTEPNMKYVIKHNFDLGGESITIPENCVLEFDGGSLSDSNIVFNNTTIKAENNAFNNVRFTGSIKDNRFYVKWCITQKIDGKSDITNILKDILTLEGGCVLFLEKDTYCPE